MRNAALAAALICAVAPRAQAGHEVPYYPSFYPQEIRIEPLDPETAARQFANAQDPLHAYVGTAPRFLGDAPGHLKSIVSLRSFIVASASSTSPSVPSRDAHCRAIANAAESMAAQRDVVPHRYPITPYHADYIGHADLGAAARHGPANAGDAVGDIKVRFDEVSIDAVLQEAGAGSPGWLAPPWVKEGWFQAYHLLRPAVGDGDNQNRADAIYGHLTHAEFADETERVSLQRELIAALTRGCDRLVVGYRLRREFYSDEFSNGIENILVDSQHGLNTPVFMRTVKLKDFPWNGWLRLGIDTRPTAAWNPVAGFTDAAGHLIWSAVGDSALLPIPHNSQWAHNRIEVRPDAEPRRKQSLQIPADALVLAADTARLTAAGPGKSAMAKVTYRVLASAFQDGTEMEIADLFYPYTLAFRWGAEANGAPFDPEIAAATKLLRERFKGARVVRVEETKLPIADLVFTYHSPIIEVYLDDLADDQDSALIAPPWSTVPWHVLALMEAAVERGTAAFSQQEAQRRGLPWLDLVRDKAQLAKLSTLIKEFAASSYRPAALEGLVNPEAAKARWQALDKFLDESGHLLVTNGPYRLASWSPDATVLQVVREFTYPVGLGTFNGYAYPPRALITRIEHIGSRIFITADVEMAVKQQRDRRLARTELKRDTVRDMLPIQPVTRYVLIGTDGTVVAAGSASREGDGRFAVTLPRSLPAGRYTVLAAIFLDGNTIDPSIGSLTFRSAL